MDNFVKKISAALHAQADAQRAVAMRAYMRDQFDFLGIPTPIRRQAIRAPMAALSEVSTAEIIEAANLLWKKPEREFQHTAIDLLAKYHRKMELQSVGPILKLVQEKSWWDTVDGLASVVAKVLVRLHQADQNIQVVMDNAVEHENLWVRRVAMIHQLGWRTNTDKARLQSYASALAHEKDFFIRKAIGWAFRDYAKHDPDWVKVTVLKVSPKLSPLSLREALKHLQ